MMPTPDPSAATESETTGLPGLRTWPKVYLLVTIIFVVWVVFLVALARIFS
jgi:hypothetical protein